MLSKINLISGTKFMICSFTGMQQDIPIFEQKGFKLFFSVMGWIAASQQHKVDSRALQHSQDLS